MCGTPSAGEVCKQSSAGCFGTLGPWRSDCAGDVGGRCADLLGGRGVLSCWLPSVAVPRDINNMKALEVLILDNNFITSFPPGLTYLTHLRRLSVLNNPLVTEEMKVCAASCGPRRQP